MTSQRHVGVVLGYVNIVAKNLVNLIYTPMLLAFVGQADYGVYQTSYSFVFTLTLLSFGFSQAYVRFFTQKKRHGTRADICRLNGIYLTLYTIVSAAALLLGLGFAANAGVFFSDSFTSTEVDLARLTMSIMSGSIAVSLFSSIFDAYILAHEKFRFQQSRQLLATLATPFCAYVLLLFGMGVVGVAVAQLFVNVVLLLLNASFCIGRLEMRFDVRHFDTGLFREVAVFSTWLFANQIFELVNQNVPNILLGALTSATTVAVFAVSIQIRTVFFSLSTTMSNVFIPKINQMVAESDDNAALTQLMTRIGRYQAILYMWILGGFALLGHFFIVAWAGPEFKDAYWLILAMVIPLFIPLVQNAGIEIQRAKNRHMARSVCYLITAILNIVITVVMAPQIGCWAAALGFIVHCIFGTGIFMNWYYQKKIGLNMGYFWRHVLPIVGIGVLTTTLCLLGTHYLPVADWFYFAVWGIAYSLAYLGFTSAFILTESERRTIIHMLRRA